MKTLRPYQTAAIEKFLQTPEPHRLILAHAVGAGKSFTSLSALAVTNSPFVLIVVPAIVRENWLREIQDIGVGDNIDIGVIRYGRKRRLSKKLSDERDEAYAAEIQIVSYELLGEIEPYWSAIILDEVHCLRSTTSKQSKRVYALIQNNPQAHVLGLSGTPIAKDPKSIWNIVDTLWPAYLGDRTPQNGIAWSFLNRYCEKEINAYGTVFKGLREERADELRNKLDPILHRVTTQDFAAYLPPLYVQPLYYYDSRPDILKIVRDWYEGIKDEVTHIGIYCHLRETARVLSAMFAMQGVSHVVITGDMDVRRRDEALESSRNNQMDLTIGTTHALNQGISLSFQKAALVVEWVTAPDQVIQFLGRFARQDSTSQAPTHVQFLVGPNDVGRSEKLCQRIEDINTLLRPGTSETLTQEAFRGQDLTAAEFEVGVAQLIEGSRKRQRLWTPDDDEDIGDEE